MKKWFSVIFFKAFTYVLMLFVVLISTVPLLWIFLSSFKTNMEVLNGALTWPSRFSMENYITAIQVSNLQTNFINSLFISVTNTIAAILVFGMAAYVMARFNFKGSKAIFLFYSATLLISNNSMVQPIYSVVKFLGLYDTKGALIFVYTGLGMAVALFVQKSYYSNLPRELEESAYIEGAGFLKTYLKIIIPVSKPALFSVAILHFLLSWNEFLFAFLLTSKAENRTLSLSLRYFTDEFSYNYPALFAALVIVIIPSVIIYVVLQEQIMESLMTGSVKG